MPAGGVMTVVAPFDGVVSDISVKEGSSVSTGDHLLTFDSPAKSADGDDMYQALVASRTKDIDNLRTSSLIDITQASMQVEHTKVLIDEISREIGHVDREIDSRREQLRIASTSRDRYEKLAADRVVSAVQIDQQRIYVLDLEVGLESISRQRSALLRQRSALLAELDQAVGSVASIRARSATMLDQAAREKVMQSSGIRKVSVAWQPSVVASVLVSPGANVRHGQAVALLQPKGAKMIGVLLVPSANIGFIGVDDPVAIRLDAYPYQKFGVQSARVTSVSSGALPTEEAIRLMPGLNQADTYYRVDVEFQFRGVKAYGETHDLLRGMMFEADVLGERRTLAEWVLDPIYSIKGRL